jgi:hypothetical protein
VIYDSIRNVSIGDALSLVRGGPTAATDFLQRSMGEAIVNAMFPRVGEGLRVAEGGLIGRALRTATGIDFAGLQADVTRKAANGIYRAIGREEAAIRANPQSVDDPVLARRAVPPAITSSTRRRGDSGPCPEPTGNVSHTRHLVACVRHGLLLPPPEQGGVS